MQIPSVVATVNKHVTNRVQGLWAWLIPPWAVVLHTGRTSGRAYRTPVVGFHTPQGFAIPVLYGPHTQWVKNLIAANGGEIRRAGRRHQLIEPRMIPAEEITASGVAGRYTRAGIWTLVATIGPRI